MNIWTKKANEKREIENESKDIEPTKLNPWSILAGNVNRSYAFKNGKKQTTG